MRLLSLLLSLRDENVAAFEQGVVSVELVNATAPQQVSRVRPTVSFAGRRPVLQCV